MKHHKKNINKISTVFLWLLLLTFVFNIAKETVHRFTTHTSEEHPACNTETEKDDCHLFMVHHVKSDSCKGEHDHFLKKEDTCFKCEYYKEKQNQFLSSSNTSFIAFKIKQSERFLISRPLSVFSFHRFLRGPPVVV